MTSAMRATRSCTFDVIEQCEDNYERALVQLTRADSQKPDIIDPTGHSLIRGEKK
jgi:hypothetical protein